MIRFGFTEREALDLEVDKFDAYVESTKRIEAGERSSTVTDMIAAIGGALTGKGVKEFVKGLNAVADGVEK